MILASIFTIPVTVLDSQRLRSQQDEESNQAATLFNPQRFCAVFCEFDKQHPITILKSESSFYILYKNKQNVKIMESSFNAARDTLNEASVPTSISTSQVNKKIRLGCGHIFTRAALIDYLKQQFPTKQLDFFDYEDRFLTFSAKGEPLWPRCKSCRQKLTFDPLKETLQPYYRLQRKKFNQKFDQFKRVRKEKKIKDTICELIKSEGSQRSTRVSHRDIQNRRFSCRSHVCCGLNCCAVSLFAVLGVVIVVLVVIMAVGFATDVFNDN